MQGQIGFKRHRITCIMGVLPFEREKKQDIFVDLRVKADLSECSKTDCVDDTIDYTALAALCTRIAQEGQYQLLEAYAVAVMKSIFKTFRVESVWIRVGKPKALSSAEEAFVELEMGE
jgi:dihydroneopterin aldolase